MAQFRRTTAKTFVTDLRLFASLIEKEIKANALDVRELTDEFNDWMDKLRGEDFFGTEGQNDPRGDHRD